MNVHRFARRTCAVLFALALPACLAAPARADGIPLGTELPTLRGDLLSGKKIVLPDAAHGRTAVLLLGFTYASRHDVEAWAGRFRRDFAADSGVVCYEIPVIGGAGRMARPFIDRGMRRGTPRELHDRVLTVYSGGKEWKQHVGFSAPDIAYVLLVDRAGKVAWSGRGPFGDAEYRALAERAREMR